MTASDFRRFALNLPGVEENAHFGNPDFRVGGRIFATLGLEREGYGVLMLSPDEQKGMIDDEPDIFSPVPGGWGKSGSTRVCLASVTPDVLQAALRAAWKKRVAMNARARPPKSNP